MLPLASIICRSSMLRQLETVCDQSLSAMEWIRSPNNFRRKIEAFETRRPDDKMLQLTLVPVFTHRFVKD